jgi:hypothetical protein
MPAVLVTWEAEIWRTTENPKIGRSQFRLAWAKSMILSSK